MADDAWAEIIHHDGRKEKCEFMYGAGFLSQSSRKISLPDTVEEIVVYSTKGESRKVKITSLP